MATAVKKLAEAAYSPGERRIREAVDRYLPDVKDLVRSYAVEFREDHADEPAVYVTLRVARPNDAEPARFPNRLPCTCVARSTTRHVCATMLDSRSRLRKVFTLIPSSDLMLVAELFNRLQDSRQEADYDVSIELDRGEAALGVQSAEEASAAWKRVRNTEEANVFLLALSMKKDWPRS